MEIEKLKELKNIKLKDMKPNISIISTNLNGVNSAIIRQRLSYRSNQYPSIWSSYDTQKNILRLRMQR